MLWTSAEEAFSCEEHKAACDEEQRGVVTARVRADKPDRQTWALPQPFSSSLHYEMGIIRSILGKETNLTKYHPEEQTDTTDTHALVCASDLPHCH